MGTRFGITVYAPSEARAADAAAAAFERIAEIEDVLSDYRPASEARRLAGRPAREWHDVSFELMDVLVKSRRVHEASVGAFDPTVGPLTSLWRESRATGALPDEGDLLAARARSGFGLVEIDSVFRRVRLISDGMRLDFGGIGKGYAADEALKVLRKRGVPSALIDAGGDVVAGDAPPGAEFGWEVRVSPTGDDGDRVATFFIANEAVATSGSAAPAIEIDGVRYGHIVDPTTGLGVTLGRAATVRAPSGWLADAAASAACLVPPERVSALARALPGAEIFVHEPAQPSPDSTDSSSLR